MITTRWLVALGVAGVVAVAMPALLLPAGAPQQAARHAALAPLVPDTPPVLSAVFERRLFAVQAGAAAEALPQDAPQLIGIVGRIDRDAIAMIRAADGRSRTLAIGESVDGWTLASLAIDAAFFTRGSERVRVPLPAGDGPQ